jgi:hypothetical protein
VVTVGQSRTAGGFPDLGRETEVMNGVYRSMSTAIENGALQRVAGVKEQGVDQDIRQVLGVGDGTIVAYRMCVVLLTMMFILRDAMCEDDTSVPSQIRAK